MNNLGKEFRKGEDDQLSTSKCGFLWVIWAIFNEYGSKMSEWVFTEFYGFYGLGGRAGLDSQSHMFIHLQSNA